MRVGKVEERGREERREKKRSAGGESGWMEKRKEVRRKGR